MSDFYNATVLITWVLSTYGVYFGILALSEKLGSKINALIDEMVL